MKHVSISDVGSAIRSRREALGLSQARLARLVGLSRATINEFEAGATDLGIAKVLAIARILGLGFGIRERAAPDGGWLDAAAKSASASYRTSMPPAALAQAIRTGVIDARYRAHMATFLDEASPATLVKAVAGAFAGKVPKSAWRNVARMARTTLSNRDELA